MNRPRKNWPLAAVLAGGWLAAAAGLAGCGGAPGEAQPAWQGVTVTGDTLCFTRKPTWSVFDTPDTIAAQVAAAELWDKRCAKRGNAK
jgi:hypothetical protein